MIQDSKVRQDGRATGRKPWAFSRRGILGLLAASLVSVALVVLLAARLVTASGAAGTGATAPLIGHQAPSFTVNLWNGKPGETLSLSSLRGKPVVVNFWASWCDECQTEQYVLSQAWDRYQSQGVAIVGVAFQDKQADGTAFLTDRKVTYPAGGATTAQTPIDYAVTGVPETVFIDRNGVVVAKTPGAIDDVTLARSIQALLK